MSDYLKAKRFVDSKNFWLHQKFVPEKITFEFLIKWADDLGFISSKAQLERYMDHYYPKEEK